MPHHPDSPPTSCLSDARNRLRSSGTSQKLERTELLAPPRKISALPGARQRRRLIFCASCVPPQDSARHLKSLDRVVGGALFLTTCRLLVRKADSPQTIVCQRHRVRAHTCAPACAGHSAVPPCGTACPPPPRETTARSLGGGQKGIARVKPERTRKAVHEAETCAHGESVSGGSRRDRSGALGVFGQFGERFCSGRLSRS